MEEIKMVFNRIYFEMLDGLFVVFLGYFFGEVIFSMGMIFVFFCFGFVFGFLVKVGIELVFCGISGGLGIIDSIDVGWFVMSLFVSCSVS